MRCLVGLVLVSTLVSVSTGMSLRGEKRRVRRQIGIFPGTLWCGAGNAASSQNDLATGTGRAADMCCRTHDSCPTQILPYKFDHGIFNLRPWPISHCSCDNKFYDCLTANKDAVSDSVGTMYFNKLRVPCFDNGKTTMRTYIIQTNPGLNDGNVM
ncbi:phospholipase A2 isozymes PA3A/PA3B/PA5-like [Lineus longissimus]|uniref:phospholipase A2 isozymes PA3A/PA3B/PA5-like n=1 Tax=Lineus longissimus TaxID=88925 RepID=UPI00315C6C7B